VDSRDHPIDACVDFMKNDPLEFLELQPERVLSFEPISGAIGDARLRIEHLCWDDVEIYHDLGMPLKGIDQWLALWFDENDERLEATAEFSNAIHSLLVEADHLSIDFASAPTVAFWELLALLEAAGAKSGGGRVREPSEALWGDIKSLDLYKSRPIILAGKDKEERNGD
jgi:hypothetical protein